MATKTKPCLCSTYEFGTTETDPNTGEPFFEGYTTGCRQTTTKIFAQGHDAKLVGYLVRAELAGEEINHNSGGVTHTWGKAVAAALWTSEALALKAQAQLDATRARLAKKAATEAKKAARKSAKAAAEPVVEAPKAVVEVVPASDRQATIKVGRWTYLATIQADGNASYKTKLGQSKTALAGTYTEI